MAELKRAGIGCPYCGNDLYLDFDICPHCGKEVPETLLKLIQSKQSPPQTKQQETISLIHFEDLEEVSKTKIGTFERLHKEYISKTKKLGFDDTDYAPLVNLLSSALELELSFALYDKFYSYWQVLQKLYEINLPANREDCTLGTINFILEKADKDSGKNLPQHNKEDWRFAEKSFLVQLRKHLNEFVVIRNDSAHKKSISEQRFNSFYNRYKDFYNNNMESILTLKKRGDSRGYRLFVEMRKNFPLF